MLMSFILIILLCGFVAQGWKDGLIQTVGRVIGSFVGFIIARSWSVGLAFIAEIILPENWARLVAFIVIFAFVTQLVGLIFHLVDRFFRIVTILPIIKSINGLAGGILGTIEGIVMLGGTIWVITTFSLFPTLTNLLNDSSVSKLIKSLFDILLAWAK